MKNNLKVCFDFDGTLDRKHVQDYAKSLIIKGYEIWICTSRLEDTKAPNKEWNDDLYKIALSLKIPNSRIKFMNYDDKFTFFIDNDFIFHLDDDWIEINQINSRTKTMGVSCFGTSGWKKKCNTLLELSCRY